MICLESLTCYPQEEVSSVSPCGGQHMDPIITKTWGFDFILQLSPWRGKTHWKVRKVAETRTFCISFEVVVTWVNPFAKHSLSSVLMICEPWYVLYICHSLQLKILKKNKNIEAVKINRQHTNTRNEYILSAGSCPQFLSINHMVSGHFTFSFISDFHGFAFWPYMKVNGKVNSKERWTHCFLWRSIPARHWR